MIKKFNFLTGQSCAPLTCDTQKGIKQVQQRFDFLTSFFKVWTVKQ